MKKYVVLFIIGIAVLLLMGCSNPKEDKARIDILIGFMGKMSIPLSKTQSISVTIL